jgi:general stress protein YciG
MTTNNPGDHPQSHPHKGEDERSPSIPNRDEQSRNDKEPHHDDTAHKGGTRSGNRGNFANDPERARKAGQKGGKA